MTGDHPGAGPTGFGNRNVANFCSRYPRKASGQVTAAASRLKMRQQSDPWGSQGDVGPCWAPARLRACRSAAIGAVSAGTPPGVGPDWRRQKPRPPRGGPGRWFSFVSLRTGVWFLAPVPPSSPTALCSPAERQQGPRTSVSPLGCFLVPKRSCFYPGHLNVTQPVKTFPMVLAQT